MEMVTLENFESGGFSDLLVLLHYGVDSTNGYSKRQPM